MELAAITRSRKEVKSVITEHYMKLGASAISRKSCYTVMVYGRRILTTATDDPVVLAEWLDEEVKKARGLPFRHYGFELEIDVTTRRIGTLQICTQDRCLVFQLDHKALPPALPPALFDFLLARSTRLIGSFVVTKIGVLRTQFPFRGEIGILEMGQSAPFVRDLKVAELDSMGLGVVETDWYRLPRKLTTAQVHYACLDAFLNLHCVTVRMGPPIVNPVQV